MQWICASGENTDKENWDAERAEFRIYFRSIPLQPVTQEMLEAGRQARMS